MNSENRDMERRVWQRVSSQGRAYNPDTAQIMHFCARAAGIFRGLSQNARDHRREKLRALMAGELENLSILRGMERFSGRAATETVVMNHPPEGEAALLRQCVELIREIWIGFASRTADPEFGGVFQTLADLERRRLTDTLRLLGDT